MAVTSLKSLAVLAASLAVASCGTAVIDPVVAPTDYIGLEAHWPFDDGVGTVVRDSSDNRFDGTANGGTWTTGRFGGALFLKRGEHVVISNFPQATPSWTVSLWVRFAAGDMGSNRSPLIGNEMNGGGWEVNAPDGATPPALEFAYPMGANARSHFNMKCCTPTTGEWVHVTVTIDGATEVVSLYEGETQRDSTTAHSPIMPGNVTLTIGSPNGNQFQGTLDEIRIYNRVLTQAEIGFFNRFP